MHFSFLTLQRGNALHDAPRRKRTRSVRNGMRRRAPHDSRGSRSSRSSVGMHFTTLCVARGRAASGTACDALRRKRTRSVRNGMRRRAPHDGRGSRSSRSSVGMHFTTLCVARGRAASGTACDAERRTMVEVLVPHAPAWECISRRCASQEDAERPERHATQSAAR